MMRVAYTPLLLTVLGCEQPVKASHEGKVYDDQPGVYRESPFKFEPRVTHLEVAPRRGPARLSQFEMKQSDDLYTLASRHPHYYFSYEHQFVHMSCNAPLLYDYKDRVFCKGNYPLAPLSLKPRHKLVVDCDDRWLQLDDSSPVTSDYTPVIAEVFKSICEAPLSEEFERLKMEQEEIRKIEENQEEYRRRYKQESRRSRSPYREVWAQFGTG